jgi:L-seryl-tRNA(Ser) seleniumtransferase
MSQDALANTLRLIPSVDKVLAYPEVSSMVAGTTRGFVTGLLKNVLACLRQELKLHPDPAISEEETLARALQHLKLAFAQALQPSLRRVINATGVVLHTNLGRAPLSSNAMERIADVGGRYSNLEYDLEKGTRGQRDQHVSALLEQLLGCEHSVVVNNNAAALFLILNTLAEGGEVLISRGELIEIGDSFRIPEILEKSGAVLREVGTTNRTRLEDYQGAFNERTRLVLRVHPSNFRMVGFTSRPDPGKLLHLCQSLEVPLVEDLGSGCLLDLGAVGIADEPLARKSLEQGVPVVCFSGDKLLGGPQAGIVAGKAEYVRRCRRNPLFRTLRVDKLSLAALEGTLFSYLVNPDMPEIPTTKMIQLSSKSIGKRAEAIVAQLTQGPGDFEIRITDGVSMVGGGSTPEHGLPTQLISLRSPSKPASEIERQLRMSSPPVLTRIEKDCVLIDLRTVFPEEESDLIRTVESLWSR